MLMLLILCFFFFNDTATTEIYTLSLHDALPIFRLVIGTTVMSGTVTSATNVWRSRISRTVSRSEEHTSELQSLTNLVCRLLLEKKKTYHTLLVAQHNLMTPFAFVECKYTHELQC